MPLDSEIPLSVRPPVFNSAFQNSAQLLALRGSIQEQQLRQAQIANEQELARERQRANNSAISTEQAAQLTDAFRLHFADPQTGVIPEDKIGQFEGFLSQNGLGAHAAAGRNALIASNEAIQKHQQYLDDQKAQAFASVRNMPLDMQVTIVGNRLAGLGIPANDAARTLAQMVEQGPQTIQAGMAASQSALKDDRERLKTEAETSAANALADQRRTLKPADQPLTPDDVKSYAEQMQAMTNDIPALKGLYLTGQAQLRSARNHGDAQAIVKQIGEKANAYTIASANRQGANDNRPTQEPKVVKYWADQVQSDPSMMSSLSGDAGLKNAVLAELGGRGVPLNKLTLQSRQMSETAKEILPHIDTIEKEWDNLNKLGLTGPLSNRWADFVANKVGAGELAGGNATNAAALGKFKTDVGLMMTAVARAHGGARGGGSPAMLEHMQDLMDSVGKDFPTFKGNLEGVRDWMQGYANMSPGVVPGTAPPTPSDSVVPPTGAKILRYNPATGKFE